MEKKYDTKKITKICLIGLAAVILIAMLGAILFPSPTGPSVRRIFAFITPAVIIWALGIIVLFIYRAVKNKRVKIISTIFLCLAFILVVGINLVLGNFNVMANQLLDRNKVTAEDIPDITARAKDLTERIEAEGIVLLKNDTAALPFADTKVNVFGYASQRIIFGGAGSGSADESKNVSLRTAMESQGLELNANLYQFYEDRFQKKKATNVLEMLGGDISIPEPAITEYSDSLISEAKSFSENALIVFSRNGGEGADMPFDMTEVSGETGKHYLELTQNEIDLLNKVKENFKNVIVVINSSTPMELGFIDDEKVDGALWIGGPGSVGLTALAKILTGETNPSGRLPDIYAYDSMSSPAYFNAGSFNYLGSEHKASGLAGMFGGGSMPTYTFLNYQEGIYIGYRYYETAAVDGFIDYDKTVQYPFGYGLSYTEFTQEMGDLQVNGGEIAVNVTVTNTGDIAGKEVAQLYYTAPYTKGGIEKSHVVLAAFDKTQLLAPGESETLTLTFKEEDMASYDYKTDKAYVLEPGQYEIKLMKNSHEVIDSRNYTVDAKVTGRSSDIAAATNQFDYAASDIVYISRADWAGTMPTERTKDIQITPELMAQIEDLSIEIDPNATDIVTKNHGLTLADMKGLAYDDPKWDQLLEQLSVKDMSYLIGTGGWQTVAIPSVGKPQVIDIDGPAGLNGLINGTTGNQYPTEVVIAATWNTDLAEEFGMTFGEEAAAKNVSGVYGPAMNTHRTPFSGRNFEYYSEDGLLAGKLGAAMVRGLNSTNTYAYIKHFALDDQETNTVGQCVWSNEQAIREIYLKPFEITVKEGGAKAVMSSWNRIGTKWTGASKSLLTEVLRNEWGFTGVVITDNSMMGVFMDGDQAVAAGNDLMLSSLGTEFDYANTATGRQNMRNASHNILYIVANSNALDLVKVGVPTWIFVFVIVDIVLLSLLTLGAIGCTKKRKPKKSKKEPVIKVSKASEE